MKEVPDKGGFFQNNHEDKFSGITGLSIKRPTALFVVYTILLFLGGFSFYFLPYELLPRFSPAVIAVSTVYPGASPGEVEEEVTKKIEDALSSVENTQGIRSISQENISVVRIDLKANENLDETLAEAQRKINTIRAELPDGVREPILSRFDINDFPVMRIGVFSNTTDVALSTLVKDEIQAALAKVAGVAEIRLVGLVEEEVQINVDPRRLEAYRVSLLQIIQALKSSNLDIPVGNIQDKSEQRSIIISGKFNSLQLLKDLVIGKTYFGANVKLRDVATIEKRVADQKIINRTNGKNSIGIDILKQGDANAVQMSSNIRQNLSSLEEEFSDVGLQFVIAQDTSEFTLKASNAVIEDLLLAVLLVSVVMLIFLHSLRNSFIVLVSIPVSIISTFTVIYLAGYSLNLMTLLGLSLSIGILVDDSIVVIENIYRHFEMLGSRQLTWKERWKAAFQGRMEIGFTALSITLIDVVVFAPIILAFGLIADLFRPFAVVIVTSTLLSLFVSFTLVPFLASRLGKLEQLSELSLFGKFIRFFEKGIDAFTGFILGLLNWSFRRKWIPLATSFLLFLGSIALITEGFIGLDFLQAGDRGEFVLELELPSNASTQETESISRAAESIVLSIPEVESVFTTVGITSSARLTLNANNIAELSVKLIDKNDRTVSTANLARQLKYKLEAELAGVKISPVEINLLGIRDDGPVEVILTGLALDELEKVATDVVAMLDSIPGSVEVKSLIENDRSELNVALDYNKMAQAGISAGQVGIVLRTAFLGNTDTRFSEENKNLPINLRLAADFRNTLEDIEKLTVLNKEGGQIQIKQIATLEERSAAVTLERTNRQRSVTVKSQVVGRPAGSVANDLQNMLEEKELPQGLEYQFTGNIQRQRDSFITLGVAFGISVLFVYLIMVALYDSYVYPFVVLFSIPMAIIGALIVLGLTKNALTVFTIMGLIMLVGLVGKNAILVVDFANKLQKKGYMMKEALFEATRLRIRPILMTNISMVIGLVPIALASGAGSEWKNGLAWALIGGLSSSMLLSLIVVPLVYYQFDRWFISKEANPELVK